MSKFYLLFISVFLVSCDSSNKVGRFTIIKLEPIQSFNLEHLNNQYPHPNGAVSYTRNDSNFIMVYDQISNNLIEYLEETGEVNTIIPTGFYKKDMTFRFDPVSRDSIFIIYNPSQRPDYTHDSILMLVNHLGKVIKYYSLDDAPVWTRNNPRYPRDSVSFVLNQAAPIYSENKLFIDMRPYGYGFGDSLFYSGRYPIGAHINLNNDSLICHYIKFPGKPSIFYPKTFVDAFRIIGHNGNPIYSFSQDSRLFEYDLKTNRTILHRAKSVLIDTIYPLKNINSKEPLYKRPAIDAGQFQYKGIKYNPKLHLYYRTYVFPSKRDDEEILNPRWGFILLDTNFNKIGEGLFPLNYWMTNIFNDSTMIFYDSYHSNDNNFSFTKFAIHKVMGDKEFLLNMVDSNEIIINKGGVDAYISDLYNPKESDANILFLPLGYSCISCINSALSYYAVNKDRSFNHPLYLVLAAENRIVVNQALKDAGLSKDDPNILIDSVGNFLNYNLVDKVQSYLLKKREGEIKYSIMLIPETVSKLEVLIQKD